MSIPGVGPVCATALEALAPPPETFARGRDFAAWLGLTPRQNSSGGKARLGRISRMGQRDLRRLLIIGAMAVVRWAARRGAPAGSWLARMMARKPRMLVAIALANRIARVAWALMAKAGFTRVRPRPRKRGGGGSRVDVVGSTEDYGQTVKKTGSGKPAHRMAP